MTERTAGEIIKVQWNRLGPFYGKIDIPGEEIHKFSFIQSDAINPDLHLIYDSGGPRYTTESYMLSMTPDELVLVKMSTT